MSRLEHVRLMAEYNQWMNRKLYLAAHALPEAELREDRGAYFGSIFATLNHICVADLIWLGRMQGEGLPETRVSDLGVEVPESLDAPLVQDFDSLTDLREQLDGVISDWAHRLSEPALDTEIRYHNLKGVGFSRRLYPLLMHLFNHQTHHRGQASTLLSQSGVDVGVTDLVALLAEQDAL